MTWAMCPSEAMHHGSDPWTPLRLLLEQAQQAQPSQSTATPLGTHTPLRNSLSWKDRHKKGLLGLDRAASSSLADRAAPPAEALHAVRKPLIWRALMHHVCVCIHSCLRNQCNLRWT